MISSICIFGDSVARGVVFDAVKNKYSLLKESFAHIVERQQKISILNFAKFGCTVTMGSEILKRHESKLNQFDYTVLEFGGNDCDYNWAEVSQNPFLPHLCNTPIPVFKEKYLEIINRVIQNGGKPVLLNLPPIDPKRYFQWISRGLNGKNILTFLGEIEKIYKWQEMYSIAIEELAKEKKIPFVDIRSGFLNKNNFADFLCEDGIHPNEKGHLLISNTFREKAFL